MWRGLTFDRIPLSKEEAGLATLGGTVGGCAQFRRVCLHLSKLALAGSQGVRGSRQPGGGGGDTDAILSDSVKSHSHGPPFL